MYTHRRMGTLWLGGAEGLICPKFYTDQARIQDFLKGGGWRPSQTPPPPLDIGHVTSSTLQNWKTPPLLDIHKHPPPLEIVRVTSSTLQWGWWSVPVTHTLHRFSVSGQVQGGGGSSPLSLLAFSFLWPIFSSCFARISPTVLPEFGRAADPLPPPPPHTPMCTLNLCLPHLTSIQCPLHHYVYNLVYR